MRCVMEKTCAIDDCDRPHYGRGWCRRHWKRWWRYGDPLAGSTERGLAPEDRFARLVDRRGRDDCWPWLGGSAGDGYGAFHVGAMSKARAHRFAYEMWVGPIPDGLQLDHLCHTRDRACPGGESCPHRGCVNPAHLEPVTAQENSRRSPHTYVNVFGSRTHCARGHEYTPENTNRPPSGGRQCRTCNREKCRAWWAARKGGHAPYRANASGAARPSVPDK